MSRTASSSSAEDTRLNERRAAVLVAFLVVRFAKALYCSLSSAFYAPETYRWEKQNDADRYSGIVIGMSTAGILMWVTCVAQVSLRTTRTGVLICLGLFLLWTSPFSIEVRDRSRDWWEFVISSVILNVWTNTGVGIVEMALFEYAREASSDHPVFMSGFLGQSWAVSTALGGLFGVWLKNEEGFEVSFYALARLHGIQLLTVTWYVQSTDTNRQTQSENEQSVDKRDESDDTSVFIVYPWLTVTTAVGSLLTLYFLVYPRDINFGTESDWYPGFCLPVLLLAFIFLILDSRWKLNSFVKDRLIQGGHLFLYLSVMKYVAFYDPSDSGVVLGSALGLYLSMAVVVLCSALRRMGYSSCVETYRAASTVITCATILNEIAVIAVGAKMAAEFDFASVAAVVAGDIGGLSTLYLICRLHSLLSENN